ncbi:Lrp/AsnC family leucine-responsive transcriptional regulator [Bradyrhizobium sp. USDA 3686]|nr:Lrp/AsnC family leucine-responsive transcriptional regulator [Bradyrhizobium canariense]
MKEVHYGEGGIMRCDRIDAHILEIVQKNNRLTSETIGELAGLSATACQRRLKRLRSEGIIESDVSIVSAKAVGRPIQMLVLVTLERERSDIIDRFKNAIKSSAEVVNGFYVTRDADFVLYITARTMDD